MKASTTLGHRQWKRSILTGNALCAPWWPFPHFIWNSNTSTSSGAGVGIAGGQHLVVTVDVHQQGGRQNRSNLEGPLVPAIQAT